MSHYTVADHFKSKEPVVRAIYDRLLTQLRTFGDVCEAPKKTSIHLDNTGGFAGVYALKSAINLKFRLTRRLENARIIRVDQLSARRFLHTVKLQSEDDIDDELVAWLKEAYELAG